MERVCQTKARSQGRPHKTLLNISYRALRATSASTSAAFTIRGRAGASKNAPRRTQIQRVRRRVFAASPACGGIWCLSIALGGGL